MTPALVVVHRWACAECGSVVEHRHEVAVAPFAEMPRPCLPGGWHTCDGLALCPEHAPHWHSTGPAVPPVEEPDPPPGLALF